MKKMTFTTILILIIIGVVAGMLSGLIGIGGGIVIVPALVFFLGFSQLKAQGTSLGILLLPVGLLAVTQYYKQGHIDVKVVLIVSASFLVGGLLGSKLALSVSETTVKKFFAMMLIFIAFKMLFIDKEKPKVSSASNSTKNIQH
ncbi:MAG: sulfite exporter TauE/SafE family protein [Chitinophagaceae bacterium]|nr:sulfite exporter TauE/SafE family protein [Chitinophagaceae bacterium]MBP9741490.1 sulfite exporter TauE/SafE family protein [Chitinophagaceae bacterium]